MENILAEECTASASVSKMSISFL